MKKGPGAFPVRTELCTKEYEKEGVILLKIYITSWYFLQLHFIVSYHLQSHDTIYFIDMAD